MCEYLSANHNLFKAFTTRLACEIERMQASGRCSGICLWWKSVIEHRLQAQRTPLRRFDSSLPVEFEYVGDPSDMLREPTRTDRGTLSVPTTGDPSSGFEELFFCSNVQRVKCDKFTTNIYYYITTEFDYTKQHMKQHMEVLFYNFATSTL